jgi:hypothetical protein
VYVTADDMELILTPIAGKFPAYESIIPQTFTATGTIQDMDKLMTFLKGLKSKGKEDGVRFVSDNVNASTLTTMNMTVSDKRTWKDITPALTLTATFDAQTTFILNTRYCLTALQNLASLTKKGTKKNPIVRDVVVKVTPDMVVFEHGGASEMVMQQRDYDTEKRAA